MRRSPLIACLGVWLVSALLSRSEPVPVNGLAVIVNDAIITYENIVEASLPDEQRLRNVYGGQPQVLQQRRDQLRRAALEELVERQLILHEFKNAGYKIPETIFEEHINRVIKGRIRDRFGDRARMIKSLQAQGMKYEALRERIREEFIIDVMTAKNISSEILISPFKIETYYSENRDKFKVEDQVKLRMIFLANKADRDGEATKKVAEEITAKLESGGAFAELASSHSDGSQRSQGGDWGWTERSVLRADLAEIAFSLKPGERSAIIEKSDGCYLMLVEEARAAHVRPLPEVRDEIERTLKVEEQQRLRKQWIERLKNKSFIRYFPVG